MKNGLNYPASEVNYEQSHCSSIIMFLLQLYMETGRQKYLDGAKFKCLYWKRFNGKQPSYHLNEIAIRHWDGYWFGKREMWGDTFPHYWSTLSELLSIFMRNVLEIILIKACGKCSKEQSLFVF